ncbi:hypothetical protein HYC85_029784 [Camellia sinensis]|uniref:Uncharacterized protein n=1 Tax=Camellia sinensis TaxID=4442 RepID=A0A7J7FYV1_CAMSI|nr:hypothetical protein HYC85_029784 [Camellia sinensis]
MTFLLSGFALLVVGASAIRPCNLVFGADQFNPKAESGKRAISSFFNWYYFTFTFAMMVSLTSNVNWALGLAIPTFLMFLSCAVFFIGTRIYVMMVPHGSPLTSVVQVIVAAIKKRKVELIEQSFFLIGKKETLLINCAGGKISLAFVLLELKLHAGHAASGIVRALPLLSFPGQVPVLVSHYLTRVKDKTSKQYVWNCQTVLTHARSGFPLRHTIGPGGTLYQAVMTDLSHVSKHSHNQYNRAVRRRSFWTDWP